MGINGNNQVIKFRERTTYFANRRHTCVPIARKRMDLLWTIYSLQLSHLKRTVNLVESGGIRSCSLG